LTGYSGTPLPDKLGIRPGMRIIVSAAPDGWIGSTLVLPSGVRAGDFRMKGADLILVFCRSRQELERALSAATARLAATGSVWVAWPKRSSGVPTDLREDGVREAALPLGLVDMKVAALDETWSGLKLVVRSHLRACWPARP
jgi:hypothetical protein